MSYKNYNREQLLVEIEFLKEKLDIFVHLAEGEHYEHMVLEYDSYRGSQGFAAHQKDQPNCLVCGIIKEAIVYLEEEEENP